MSIPKTEIILQVESIYGSHLQRLEPQWKLCFWACLVNWERLKKSYSADECINQSCGESLNIWEENPYLAGLIEEALINTSFLERENLRTKIESSMR